MSLAITLLNHASVLIEYGDVRLLTDPWFFGTCFKEGWGLRWDNPDALEKAKDATHLWISHFHGDHLHFPTLAKLYNLNSDLVVLANDDANFVMSDSMRRIGFKDVRSLRNGKKTVISGDLIVARYPSTGIDNMLLMTTPAGTILNYNDCNLPLLAVRMLKKKVGHIDVLLNNFNHASKLREYPLSNPESIKARQIQTFKSVCDVLDPAWVIPFASHHYYRDRLSEEQNLSLLETEELAESDTRILPVAIGDGVTWSGDGPKLHQSVCSGVTLRDRDFYSPAEQSEDAILKAAQASAGRLNAGFLSLPRFLETTLRIYVLDLHKTLIFSLREDIEWDDFIGESTSDISTHSGSLHAWFASAYGTDGFDVGAHYRILNAKCLKRLNTIVLSGLLLDNNLSFRHIASMLLSRRGIAFFWHRRGEIVSIVLGRRFFAGPRA